MKIHLVEGRQLIEAHAMLATANMEAASMVNMMRTERGMPAIASADTWRSMLDDMNEGGAVTIREIELKGLAMRDWRISDGHHHGSITFLPWPLEIEANLPEALLVKLWHPEDTRMTVDKQREIWIEIAEEAVIVHCYNSDDDDPVNVSIRRDEIIVDSTRLEKSVVAK